MANILKSYDYAVHSDFLIHWTGKDIDEQHQPNWDEDDHRSRTDNAVTDLYLTRLRSIVTYGLWMTGEGVKTFEVGSSKVTVPATPQCCFTELKLSESRRHARSYGRLGIGVKRRFLFDWFGRPLAYFGFGEPSNDKFLDACASDLRDKSMLNFFKPMNSDKRRLTFDLYSESEWRILFFEELLKKKIIIDPRDPANSKEHDYFKTLTPEEQGKLRYLIPLDGWFAMIIYPSLQALNRGQHELDRGIVAQIERIKSKEDDHGNIVEGLKNPKRGSWPIEVNLDSCRHF